MLSKRNNLFPCLIIFLIVIAIFIGCASNEEKARKVYNEAVTVERDGDSEKAIELYNKIVKKFPETETAIKANEKLSIMKIFSNATKETLEETKQIRKEIIESALKMYKLDNGTYPSTQQGLQALVEQPTSGKISNNWRPGGYLENASILQHVQSYSLSDDGLNFTLIMK